MELCLVSSNIRFDNPHDGSNSWAQRRLILKNILLKHSPDIIATQEGRIDQLKDLEVLLVDYEIVDQHRSWIRERMYPSIFIRKNRFELGKSGDHWLSLTPDIAGSLSFESTFPRLMTWTKLQLKNHTKSLLVVNTHLDHIKPETRQNQAKVLTNEIKRIWDGESPILMMGDFNDSPESDVRNIIEAKLPKLVDAWKKFNSIEETSHHYFKGEIQNGSRIDWILVDQKIAIKSCLMDKSMENGVYPSDHFPIVCKIKI